MRCFGLFCFALCDRQLWGQTYLSESATADRNHCLGYLMQEAGAFPEGVSLKETLEFYFM